MPTPLPWTLNNDLFAGQRQRFRSFPIGANKSLVGPSSVGQNRSAATAPMWAHAVCHFPIPAPAFTNSPRQSFHGGLDTSGIPSVEGIFILFMLLFDYMYLDSH